MLLLPIRIDKMNTIKHTAHFEIEQPVEVLFPLFSAEGEKLWVPSWDYEDITGSKEIHEDYIFLTKNHDHASTKAIWLVKRYDLDNYLVQFYKVEPEDKVGIISVQCIEKDANMTRIEVTYEYIALTNKGNRFIEKFTQPQYEIFINEWKSLLVQYFESKC